MQHIRFLIFLKFYIIKTFTFHFPDWLICVPYNILENNACWTFLKEVLLLILPFYSSEKHPPLFFNLPPGGNLVGKCPRSDRPNTGKFPVVHVPQPARVAGKLETVTSSPKSSFEAQRQGTQGHEDQAWIAMKTMQPSL